jgi:hypothetical protein
MDPTANLREQLALAASILDNDDKDDNQIVAASVNLADLVIGLNEWITKHGGFLPKQWSRAARD